MKFAALWSLGVALLLVSCADPAFAPSSSPTTGGRVAGFLPATALPAGELTPAKADYYDDYRDSHPQWYAITEPPEAGTFRAMREWEPMQSMIVTATDYLPDDPQVFNTMAKLVNGALNAGEVWVIHDGDAVKTSLTNKVKTLGASQATIDEKLKFFKLPNDAIWTIDYAPLPLVNLDNTVAFADFVYYPERILDDAIPSRLGNLVGATTYRSPISLEGGNFQADGEGRCYTTQRELVNTGLSRDELSKIFKEYFACDKTIILKDITTDGTGHIDMFFKLYARDGAVLGDFAVADDSENAKRMDDNEALLKSVDLGEGSTMTVHRMVMPNPGDDPDYGDIPRTFINSTLYVSADGTTKLNLWPTYSVDKDREAQALATWKEAMPEWTHLGINSDQISLYSGAIHCISRTIPALPFEKWVPDGTCVGGSCNNDDDGAYSGACISEKQPDPGCWGPKWTCSCNDCSVCPMPTGCGNGTCSDTENCQNCAEDCGCGEGEVCSGGECKEDHCGDETCDPDESCSSCAADCGCANGTTCSLGACVESPCGGITYDGCCFGSVEVYCEEDKLVLAECDGACGWLAADGWYGCGGSGSAPGSNPPKDCTNAKYDFPPGCADRQCGDNGGGLSCGTCAEGLECEDFQCIDPVLPTDTQEGPDAQGDSSLDQDGLDSPETLGDTTGTDSLQDTGTAEDTGPTTNGKGSSSSCSSTGQPASGAALLLALALLGLGLLRSASRRRV
jgi:MYXO-CTERM domain-containing protein